jgi:hypothetical protein
MSERALAAFKRFSNNMKRIDRLTKLLFGDLGAKPTSFMVYEGVSADIFRMIVVFLHATLEDLVRSLLRPNMTFTFSSANDIDKALRRDGYDPSGLKELKPALDQLAKRRQRIVHHGDLLDRAPDVDSWRFADFWQLMHWNLNVVGALYVLLPAVTEQNELYTKADSCHFEA